MKRFVYIGMIVSCSVVAITAATRSWLTPNNNNYNYGDTLAVYYEEEYNDDSMAYLHSAEEEYDSANPVYINLEDDEEYLDSIAVNEYEGDDSKEMLYLIPGYCAEGGETLNHFIDPNDAWQIDNIDKLVNGKPLSVKNDGVELIFQLNPKDHQTLMLVGGKTGGKQKLTIPSGLLYNYELFFPLEEIESFAFRDVNINPLKGVREIDFKSSPSWFLKAGQNCFAYAPDLETVVLPENLVNISYSMFENCKKLRHVEIPRDAALTKIESFAFMDCSSLESFSIPSGVEKIEMAPWRNCGSLKAIEVAENNYDFFSHDGVLYSDDASQILIQYPTGKKEDSYNVLYGTTEIGNSAFYGNPYIQKITFPASLKVISHLSFSDCKSLKDVVFNNEIRTIGNRAFQGCPELKEITLYGTPKYTHSSGDSYNTFSTDINVTIKDKFPLFVLPKSKDGDLTGAWEYIASMPLMERMEIENNEDYGYPTFFGKGKAMIYGNASPKEDVLRVINAIPKKYIAYEEIDENERITRFYLDEKNPKSPKILFFFAGTGGNDLVAILFEGGKIKEIKVFFKDLETSIPNR